MTDQPNDPIGYRQPPKNTRYQPGQSGNINGRPPVKRQDAPYGFLDELMTIIENGVEKQVTAAEAFLLKQLQNGLKGDARSQRDMLEIVEYRQSLSGNLNSIPVFLVSFVQPGDPGVVMGPLRMTAKLDPFSPTHRVRIEPWMVEAALERLGERRLSVGDQAIIVKATRTPGKVKWPAWWTVIP